MYHIIETNKSFEQTSKQLEIAVANNGFGVLHIHDIGNTLRSKEIDFKEQCRVFEVCNPVQASKVLATDMRLNMALPCRISVYTEQEKTKIGFIKPAEMLSWLSNDPDLTQIANEVEAKIYKIVEDVINS